MSNAENAIRQLNEMDSIKNELEKQRVEIETRLSSSKEQLEILKKKASDKFGVSTVDALQKKFTDMQSKVSNGLSSIDNTVSELHNYLMSQPEEVRDRFSKLLSLLEQFKSIRGV